MKRTHRIGVISGVGLSLALTLGACGDATTGNSSSADPDTRAVAAAVTVSKPDPNTIKSLFDRWNSTLATGDPEQVADLYAPNAVLLPTVSSTPRTDRAALVDYFTEFLKKKPSGKIRTSTVMVLNPEGALNTGTYDFTLTVDGEKTLVPARYTFVYELIDGEWLIVNHHSSVTPED